VHCQQDEDTKFYCNLEKTIPKHRPSSYSMKSGSLSKPREIEFIRRINAWNDWTKKNQINAYGICEKWSWNFL
jgi:sulfite reductase alpha subunit-like flavoprotein